jgi:ubiquinone/menaquinone biosynthesis C-methylase UbiE
LKKIEYHETTSDLATRIDIHNKYGGKNIDEWMLSILDLKPGMSILDVGCGSGKQCFSYFDHLNGDCSIIGGDVNESLLDQARSEKGKRGCPIEFIHLNFNERFPFPDNHFDFVSCCFAIYYAEDVPFTIGEMHRILKPGGRLFTSGPMPENKKLFYEVIRKATQNREIPPMPGSSRYGSEFLDCIQAMFNDVKVHIFDNPLEFQKAGPFVAYTRASLNEDRKIWSSFFENPTEFELIMDKIEKVAEQLISEEGRMIMTKVVGGFVATK